MKRESTSTEHEEAIVGIGNAQEAADQGDGPEALRRLGALKSMGKWALDVADKASVTVAAAALKAALGI